MSYVDLNEQRQKARRATQVILEHSQRHYGRPPEQSEYAWAQQERRIEDQAPANSFVIPDPDTGRQQIVSRPPSVARRAARFRDGLGPPPPLPRPESAYPQYTPPPQAQLLPQELVDQGITAPFRPGQGQRPRVQASIEPPVRVTRGTNGMPLPPYSVTQPLIPADLEAQEPGLTKSQKKRQRRQRSAAAKRGAPFPLPQDQDLRSTPQQTAPAQRTNGVHPTPGQEHAPRTCSDEKLAETRPGGAIIRLRCTVEQVPHIGQPHTMPLSAADGTDTQVYIVWWGPGE